MTPLVRMATAPRCAALGKCLVNTGLMAPARIAAPGREVHCGSIAPDQRLRWHVRMTPDSGCGRCDAANWRSGPKAAARAAKKVEGSCLLARCNPFPWTPGRGSLLPGQRLGGHD